MAHKQSEGGRGNSFFFVFFKENRQKERRQFSFRPFQPRIRLDLPPGGFLRPDGLAADGAEGWVDSSFCSTTSSGEQTQTDNGQDECSSTTPSAVCDRGSQLITCRLKLKLQYVPGNYEDGRVCDLPSSSKTINKTTQENMHMTLECFMLPIIHKPCSPITCI